MSSRIWARRRSKGWKSRSISTKCWARDRCARGLQVAARRGLTRFVGRQSELEQMQRALEQAKAGHGQIVGVMGEPGLGKSRLFYEFKLLSESGCLVLEAYSVSHGKASPYLPVIELLKSYFRDPAAG